jgi:D-alanine-D-alanine ligase
MEGMMGDGGEWTAAYYGQQYADSVRGLLTPERTTAEVDFILRETGIAPPAAVADVACGEGRHAREFAARGFHVTGVDQSAEFIARGRADAPERMRLLVGDMREPVGSPYDLVTLLYHSFGFFADHENRDLLRGWAERLAPGGWFALDVWNRDRIVRQPLPHREWRASDALTVREEYRFDPLTGRSEVHYTYRYADGRCYEYDASFRLYTLAELRALLDDAGLDVRAVYGSLAGEPYSLDALRTVVFARERTETTGR